MSDELERIEDGEQPEPEPPEPVTPPLQMISVRVIDRAGTSAQGAALVEYGSWAKGTVERCYVPRDALERDGEAVAVREDILDAGPPYGIPWHRFAKIKVSADDVELELRKRGVWRLEDATDGNKVMAAVLAAIKPAVHEMMRAAQEWMEE